MTPLQLAFEWIVLAAPERDLLSAGDALASGHRGIGALRLECTNTMPYARVLSDRPRLPVFNICNFVTRFRSGLALRDIGHPARAPQAWRER
jgi:hypothetical protein